MKPGTLSAAPPRPPAGSESTIASVSPELKVLNAQILGVQRNVPSMVTASLLAAGAFVYVFESHTSDPLGLRLWFCAILGVSLLRHVAMRAWRNDRRALARSPFWHRILQLLAAATGTLWGLLATVLLPDASSSLQPLTAVMVMGVSAAVVVSHVALYRAYALFLICMLAPATAGFALRPGLPNPLIALMMGLFLVLLLVGGRRSAVGIERAIRLELELRELAAAQAASRIAAEQANAAKDAFLMNMSHELRTPLHAVLSYAQLGLARIRDPDKVVSCLSRIQQSGRTLSNLLTDLLDLTAIESGSLSFVMRRCDLGDTLRTVCAEIAGPCAERSIRLDLALPEKAVFVRIDPSRFGQVIRHVLDNAIAFSPKGAAIAVELAGAEESPGGHGVRLSIADHGPGIPVEELDTVFDKFYQSTRTRTGAGGTGLGLALCRGIVNAHGGSIHAMGNAWGGATLLIEVPPDPPRPEAQADG